MSRHNIAAFTSGGSNYPSYVSINFVDDRIEITVREAAKLDGACGQTVMMSMSVEEFTKFKANL